MATVSRVLNGSGTVKSETRKKILQIIDQLAYQPNSLGRSLRLQQTHLILVALNSIANDFFAKVVKAIEEEGRKQNYHVMLCATHNDADIEQTVIHMLKNRQADGMIFMNTTLSIEGLQELSAAFPVIQCSEYLENTSAPYVSINNFLAAYEAVTHLIQTGRQKIAHISVQNDSISTKLRYNGYQQALQDWLLPRNPSWFALGQYSYQSGYAAAQSLLSLEKRPDAIFAISDRMAAGAIKCILDHGLSVPHDLSVIGFDNTEISKMYNPTISSVSQSQTQMGTLAMQMLIERISTGKYSVGNKILNHQLMIRQSSSL